MLQAFVVREKELVPLDGVQDRCWVNIVEPEMDELTQLAEQYDIPMEFLEAALDPDERSRYEREDDVDLILLRTPMINFNENSVVPYITRPLAVLIKDHLVITISHRENPVMRDFLKGRVKNFNPEHVVRFLLQIFYRTTLRFLNYLRDINAQTTTLEQQLQESPENDDLLKLMNYEKSLVYFTTSLRSNQIMLDRFKRTGMFRKAMEDEQELHDDVIIDNIQAIEMANIYTNITSGLMETFASLISNNLNRVMKTLTQITILLALPTLIASLFGMNVPLPMQENPYGYMIIIGVCVGITVAGFWAFKKLRF